MKMDKILSVKIDTTVITGEYAKMDMDNNLTIKTFELIIDKNLNDEKAKKMAMLEYGKCVIKNIEHLQTTYEMTVEEFIKASKNVIHG